MNPILDRLQEGWKEEWLSSSRRAILFLSCRSGKTSVALNIIKELGGKVLVCFPRNDIEVGWKKEMYRLGVGEGNIAFTTFLSMGKYLDEGWDLIIIDEIHELSNKGMETLLEFGSRVSILGLTGTMTNTTEGGLLKKTGLYVCSRYTIEEAVKDGVICDYEINVHSIKLDDIVPYIKTKRGLITEKKSFDNIHYILSKMKGKQKRFIELKLINILKNSLAKEGYTKGLIDTYRGERLLIFCGLTNMADRMGVPVYHSKKKEQEIFDGFCIGSIPHMACVKMLQAGITIKPINRAIINYTSGASETCCQMICRTLGKETFSPDKKAVIEFLTIDEPFDRMRASTALNMFEQGKINYI